MKRHVLLPLDAMTDGVTSASLDLAQDRRSTPPAPLVPQALIEEHLWDEQSGIYVNRKPGGDWSRTKPRGTKPDRDLVYE